MEIVRLKVKRLWAKFWLRLSGRSVLGRLAGMLAAWHVPPYHGRVWLAEVSERGYISPHASIHHRALRTGKHVFVDDRAIIFQAEGGGPIELGDCAKVYGEVTLENGSNGSIHIGPEARVRRGAHLVAYLEPIVIGRNVAIGQNSALFSYNHGIAPDRPFTDQPLVSKGPIVIGDHVWVGVGTIILDGVRIGSGAVIGAGSVVTHDIPANAIAVGVPARVIGMRTALGPVRETSGVAQGVEGAGS